MKKGNDNFTENHIPKNYKTKKDKLKFLEDTIDEHLSTIAKKIRNVTKNKILVGQRIIVLKRTLASLKIPFGQFLEENFALTKRTAQRWMKLARVIRFPEHAKLTVLGETLLLDLISLADGRPLKKYLKQNGIAVKFDKTKYIEVQNFRDEVKLLILQSPPKSTISINKTLSNLSKSLITYTRTLQFAGKHSANIMNSVALQETIKEAELLLATIKKLQQGSKS